MADYLFGNSNYTSGAARTNRDKIYGTRFTLGGTGTVAPFSIVVYSETGTINNWQCAIYDTSYNLIAVTETRLIGSGDWFEFEITTPAIMLTRGNDYCLVSWSDNNQDGGYVQAYGYGVGRGRYQDLEYGSPPTYPDPLVPTSHDRIVSIYATYVPGWSGEICGVTDIGDINSVSKSNISKIIGV